MVSIRPRIWLFGPHSSIGINNRFGSSLIFGFGSSGFFSHEISFTHSGSVLFSQVTTVDDDSVRSIILGRSLLVFQNVWQIHYKIPGGCRSEQNFRQVFGRVYGFCQSFRLSDGSHKVLTLNFPFYTIFVTQKNIVCTDLNCPSPSLWAQIARMKINYLLQQHANSCKNRQNSKNSDKKANYATFHSLSQGHF